MLNKWVLSELAYGISHDGSDYKSSTYPLRNKQHQLFYYSRHLDDAVITKIGSVMGKNYIKKYRYRFADECFELDVYNRAVSRGYGLANCQVCRIACIYRVGNDCLALGENKTDAD